MSWVALLGLPLVRLCLVSAVPVWGDLSRGKTIPEDTHTCISPEMWSCLQTESFGVGFFFYVVGEDAVEEINIEGGFVKQF